MKLCQLLLTAAVVAVFGGCGSSSSPLFDDFTPTGGSATILAPATCDIAFVGDTAIAGIVIDLTSYAESCDVIDTTQLCGNKASSTRVIGLAIGGEVGAASTDPIDPGTYSFMANPPTGVFTASAGTAAQVDENCDPVSGTTVVSMDDGSITITSITDTRVTGTASMHFDNGQAFKKPFDVEICQVDLDVCARFNPCGSHTCVP